MPKLCLTVCGTIVVLIPLLVCTTSCEVVSTKEFPCQLWFDLGFPDHWSCHSFHSVPTGISVVLSLFNPLSLTKLSQVPVVKFTTNSGATCVSFHSSTGGSNEISPIQLNIKNGFKFSVLVA